MKIYPFPVGENAIICDDSGGVVAEVISLDVAKEICDRWNAAEDQIQYKIQNIETIDAIQHRNTCEPCKVPAGSGCVVGSGTDKESVCDPLLPLEGDAAEP